MFAIIETGGKQYKVSKGSIIQIDNIEQDKENQLVFNDVLLLVDNGEIKIGKPNVANAQVRAKIVDQIKGKKIKVGKFKSKSRYRRRASFRPHFTKIMIEDITWQGKMEKSDKKSRLKKIVKKGKTS